MMPLVSIIIPCYNGQDFVAAAIESSIDQTYQNIEIIVIDDGSTDNSLEIISTFGDKIRIESTINQGVQLARNRGIELATGEYIKFLDCDDVLMLDCIETQVTRSLEFSADRKSIVYGDAVWVDRYLKPIPGYPAKLQRPDQDPISFILSCSPLTSCTLHKREYLLAVGGFDPFLVNRQENDLHLRLVLAGVEFVYLPGVTYQYRQYNFDNRLSHAAYTKMGAMYYFEVLEREQNLIEQKTGRALQPEVKTTLARYFWTYGRAVLREGYHDESKKYFDRAQELDKQNCTVGSFPYPILVKLFSTYGAEFLMNIFSKSKNIVNQFRSSPSSMKLT
jgi:glycosyltransferase involved in cell wall biosynthesis